MLINDIVYSQADADRPASICLKGAVGDDTMRAMATAWGCHSKEVNCYAHLSETIPIEMPQALALWTDGTPLANEELKPVEFYLIMMENMVSKGYEVYSAERTPSYGELNAILKDLVKLHATCWRDEAASVFPMCPRPGHYDNPGFRDFAGLMPACWPLVRDTLPGKIGVDFPTEVSSPTLGQPYRKNALLLHVLSACCRWLSDLLRERMHSTSSTARCSRRASHA